MCACVLGISDKCKIRSFDSSANSDIQQVIIISKTKCTWSDVLGISGKYKICNYKFSDRTFRLVCVVCGRFRQMQNQKLCVSMWDNTATNSVMECLGSRIAHWGFYCGYKSIHTMRCSQIHDLLYMRWNVNIDIWTVTKLTIEQFCVRVCWVLGISDKGKIRNCEFWTNTITNLGAWVRDARCVLDVQANAKSTIPCFIIIASLDLCVSSKYEIRLRCVRAGLWVFDTGSYNQWLNVCMFQLQIQTRMRVLDTFR